MNLTYTRAPGARNTAIIGSAELKGYDLQAESGPPSGDTQNRPYVDT